VSPRRPGTVVTALLVEQFALRRLLAPARVVRVGMGPGRVHRNGSRLRGSGAVLVAGVAGGTGPDVRPGDLVVASEVVDGDRRIPVPSAALLAAALRRSGLTVHVGPVAASSTIVTGARRKMLATQGILAVDMESGALAEAAAGIPFAVVRAIVDTQRHPMLRPGTPWRGIKALRSLRRAVPAMQQWLAAVGDREVLLANPRSFCAGVDRAIDIVERALVKYDGPVYVRRQIVHNAHVVRDLQQRGAVFVEEVDEVPLGARLVFAAHGVAPEVREQADRRGLAVIDATCPLVAKVHSEVKRYSGYGDSVFLIGHRDHEEVQGTLGEAPENVLVIENAAQAATVEVPDSERVSYVMQTTLAVDEAEEIADVLRRRFPALSSPRTDDICYATTNRQAALRQIAGRCDLVLVIGSTNSSNSRRLVEVAQREGATAHLVDDAGEVDLRWLGGVRSVGITAGASAPAVLVDRLVATLAGLGSVQTHESVAALEDIRFTLPREVT
jgi:4-hydroxy-3-methylbut-2-en-1-yl diphosphate reductase